MRLLHMTRMETKMRKTVARVPRMMPRMEEAIKAPPDPEVEEDEEEEGPKLTGSLGVSES